MDETQIHENIEKLVAEEHELYDRVGEGGLNADEHNRLESTSRSASTSAGTSSGSAARFESRVRIPKRLRCATPRSSSATSNSRARR